MVLERDEMKEDRLLYYPLALSLASPGLIEDSTMFCNPLFNPHEEAETSTLPQKESKRPIVQGHILWRKGGSWSGSSHSHSAVEKALAAQVKSGDWEIDRRLLKIGERIASGSCGDLYRGVYLGQDVAVKILRSEHLNESLEDEFEQEVAILR
ncbi:Serine/threonine-protein kinase STY46 [Vitis vinifera]|uniref:Serine/threonine-protein kinase STY46 n=1 Tax=Vitis vinifera TaxID=29760 RepID=A0A438DNT9_VITVI|nr:Serine/threonine-protein kinase STY46 [Vitis vinifera]